MGCVLDWDVCWDACCLRVLGYVLGCVTDWDLCWDVYCHRALAYMLGCVLGMRAGMCCAVLCAENRGVSVCAGDVKWDVLR